jgi:glycosyltransferase involved in cell wall biosynthesis
MIVSEILYVFRRPVIEGLRDVRLNKSPADNYYGFTNIGKPFIPFTTDIVFKHRFILGLQYVLNKGILHFMDIGFSILPTFILLPFLKRTDIIFATADTYGLPIALFKRLRLINNPLVINTVGLYDGLIRKNSMIAKTITAWILKSANRIVSGGSKQECQKLAMYLSLPLSQFTFIPFGIDINFFHPSNIIEKNQILIIGADPSRDWSLHAKIARQLPQEDFIIVTYKGIIKELMPKNVKFIYNVSFTNLRQLIWESKYILLLTKLNHYVSGQSTAFRCMSSAKAVIFTANPGFNEYDFINYRDCIMVSRNSSEEVIKAISYLNNKKNRIKMGTNARKIIVQKYSLQTYSRRLTKVFKGVVPRYE